MRISIYLRESLKSPKWLIPEVAQPQVPPSKKLCALTQQNRRSKRNERSGVKLEKSGDVEILVNVV